MSHIKLKAKIKAIMPIDTELLVYEELFQKFELKQLKKNEVWEKQGQISLHMGFINKGMLRQYYLKDGNEFTDFFFLEEDFVGNYISYLSKEPSHTITQALEPTELLVLPFEEFESWFPQHPEIEQISKMIGDQKLFELNKRNSSLLMDSPEERYYKLIETKPDLFNRVPQYLIAQYLGIRPESLSRIRKRHIS